MPNPLAFLAYILVTAYTPGPNNILSMSNGSMYGFKKSFPFNVGILCGFFIVMTLCTLFSAVLYTVIPKIKMAMLILGAIYMLYLAWKIFKSSMHDPQAQKNRSNFLSGMMLQFVNPKIMVYGITSMSVYILPYYKDPKHVLLFGLFLSLVGFSATLCWSAFGTVFSRLLKNHAKVLNPIMAALLVYCAVSLFF
jgi:threonine/homoserine/homoserine lactone efflux protein